MSFLKKTNFVTSAAVALAGALMLTLVLLFPAALLLSMELVGQELERPLSLIAAGLSVFLATVFVLSVRRKQPLPLGAAVAGGYAMLAALLLVLAGEGCVFDESFGWVVLSLLAGGISAAAVFAGKNRGRRRIGRRR